jgi:hypothetical protein
VTDLIIGTGKLAGRGVYAGRDFDEGEIVVPYDLTELSQSEFDALPDGEWEWTHCFWGRIFLFPPPARYVNHDDDPSTFPDLERDGDVALRPIKKGEAVTIDDRIELQHELDTFLSCYEDAASSRDVGALNPLVAEDATYWLGDSQFEGRQQVGEAVERGLIKNGSIGSPAVRWIARTYWTAACSYSSSEQARGTRVLRRIRGRWQVAHEHRS